MREPDPRRHEVFGLLAEFDRPETLLEGARRTRAAGYRQLDAYSPFPVDGMAEILGFRDRRVPFLALAGGVLGGALGYGLQVYANLDFPLDIGARPPIANPAFAMVAVELALLGAALFAIAGMLLFNHLPRLHHPLFDVESFHLASRSKFFLVVFGNDEQFDRERTRRFLKELDPVRLDLVEHTEQPE